MEQFYTLLTDIGKAKIANATALQKKLELSKIVLGDSNGNYYEPTESQTKLKNKVWEGNINDKFIDKDNPNWIVVQTIIPSQIGGFTIREAGIVDAEGDLIVVAKYPETYKPKVENGSTKDITINLILEVSNVENVTLKVDPTIIFATKKDIENVQKNLEQNIKDIIDIPVKSVNNKTGAIELKAKDIKCNDEKNIETQLADIINKTNNLNVNDYYARQDIMEMKLKLKEKLAIDFINQTGIGFYDTLENSNLIEWLTGDVSVSPSNKNASFGADGTIHYRQKGFPEFHKMRLQLNNVLINYIVALTGSNHTDTFAYNQAKRQVYPGEKLYIPLDKEEVTIKSVEPSYEPKDIQAQIDSISGRPKSTLPTNNVSMGGIDKNGNLFTGYVREEQVIIYKSTDQGSSWKEYYRFNVGYFRNPMILVYKTNIYVAFSLNGLARLLRIDTETPTLINDYNLGSTGYNFFDMAISPDGRTLHWVGTKDNREQVVYSSYNLDSQGILNGGQGADRSIWAAPVSPAVITMVRDIPVISVFKIDKASETGILSYAWASERNVWRYKDVTELSEKVKVDRYDYYNISSDFIPNQDPSKPGTLAFMWNVASKDIAGNHLRLHYTHQLGGEGVNVKQPMQIEPEPYDKFNEYFLQHTHDRTLVMACMRRSGSTDYFEEYTFSETQNKFLKVKQVASEAQTQFQQLAKLNIPRLARPTYTYVYNRGEEGSGEKRIFVRGSILVLGETGGVITMEKPVNVGGGHSLPIVSYDVKLGTQKVRLSDIIGTTYMYHIDNVKSTTVELYIQGKNIVLNSVAYAIV